LFPVLLNLRVERIHFHIQTGRSRSNEFSMEGRFSRSRERVNDGRLSTMIGRICRESYRGAQPE
jgi:hypothetical protein